LSFFIFIYIYFFTAERMRDDDFGFNELDINNVDGVIEAIRDLVIC